MKDQSQVRRYERRPATMFAKRNTAINMSKSTYDWLERVCKATNKSKSWIVEDILLDNLPEQYQSEEI
jgi:predicted DNA-binding protein